MKTIGVFDSGVGGLSVLRALLLEMPAVRFVYLADGAHAPYGERSAVDITERARRIAASLRDQYRVDALVVACNTATAMAIEHLRDLYPQWPIIGVEPALKPALQLTRTGHIGVMATRGTVESQRYLKLRDRLTQDNGSPVFHSIACDGLADAIERDDTQAIQHLSARYWRSLVDDAARTGAQLDTLVLGCTHYPFAVDLLREITGPTVAYVETGVPVARRTRSVLGLDALQDTADTPAPVQLLSTGDPAPLTRAARRWLRADMPQATSVSC